MPAFSLSGFLDAAIIVWTDHPIYAVFFCGTCLVLAWRFAFLSGVKVTHRPEMDAAEPVRRRVVLDATARFPPKAQDRRRVS